MSDNNLDQIRGSKGGKGGGSPSTAKDNLDSIAKVKILDALGEGDIDGFATPRSLGLSQSSANYNTALLKDIFLDNTPVLQETASVTNPTEDDFNFDNITVGHRRGTGTQSVIQGFAATQTEVPVNKAVTKTGAEVFEQINDASDTIDRIRFTLNFPALQKFEDDGDIVGSKVEYKFLISYDDATYVNMSVEELGETGVIFSTSGRTGDLYQRSYGFKLRDAGYTNNIKIKVQRITDDPDTKTQNSFTWFSYTKIKFDNNRYENTALVGLQTTAEQFSSIPVRNYRVRGLRTRIPNTGTVVTGTGKLAGRITYSGTWPGAGTSGNSNFTNTWHSDPAWILWDLLTEERYGLGIDPTTLDEFSFLAISQYNNEIVSDRVPTSSVVSGSWSQIANKTFVNVTTSSDHKLSSRDFVNCTFSVSSGVNTSNGTYRVQRTGRKTFRLLNVSSISQTSNGSVSYVRESSEVRFAFNGVINKEYRAYDLINAICSNMRVMPFWSAGSVTLIQDRPATQTSGSYTADGEVAPAFIFSQANVEGGNFTYEGSDIKNRATLVAVKYFDMEQRKFARVQFPIKAVISNTTIGNVTATTNAGGDIAIAKYGIVKKEINAFGCTSMGQAMRLAKWTRESEQLLTETVTFTVSIDSGIYVRPGQVIGISDRVRNGDFRRAGRVKNVQNVNDRIFLDSDVTSNLYGYRTMTGTYSQSGTTITITNTNNNGVPISHFYQIGAPITVDFTSGSAVDGNFTVVSVPSSTTFTITASSSATINNENVTVTYRDTRMVSVVMPDNSISRKEVNFLRKSDNLLDVVGVFETADGTHTPPEINAPWLLEVISEDSNRELESDLFRVVSVTESEGTKYKVTALTYNHSIYGSVDAGTDIEYRDATNIDAKPLPPTNLTHTESLYKESINQNADTDATQKKSNKAKVKSMLALKWQAADGIANYKVMYRYSNNNFRTEDVQGTTFELKNIKANKFYDFRVQSVSPGGKISKKAILNNVQTFGKTQAPNPVTGLDAKIDPEKGFILTWNENQPNPDLFNGSNPDVLFKDLDIVGYDIHVNTNDTNDIPDANFGLTTGTFLTRVQAPDVEIGINNTKLLTESTTLIFYIKARDDGNRYSDGSYTEGGNKFTYTFATPHAPVIDTTTSGVDIDLIVINFTTLRDSSGNADPNGTEIPANGFAIKHYEVRFDQNNNNITKIDTTGYNTPVSFVGTKKFEIRTVDIAGNKSAYSSIDITVEVGTVAFDTPEMDDGFVLLNWTYTPSASSVTLKEFHVKKGNTDQTFGQAQNKGRIQGTSLRVKQNVGIKRYYIKAIDINDKKSTEAFQDIEIKNPEISSEVSATIDSELLTITIDWQEYQEDIDFIDGAFSLPLKFYKIKRGKRTNFGDASTMQGFNDASTLSRGTLMATEFKEQLVKSNNDNNTTIYKYYIQPVDIFGNAGTVRDVDVEIGRPNNISNLSTEVIDNNVLLRFDDATNTTNGMPIKHYEIKKTKKASNGTYESYDNAELLGRIQGTFFVSFEDTAGEYRYFVRAIDVLGMRSSNTGFSIDAVVDEPPDFTLITDFITDFDSSTNTANNTATFINRQHFFISDEGFNFANVDSGETIQQHFIGTGSSSSPQFASPQAQIDAGFPRWLMPTETTGHFQEIIDITGDPDFKISGAIIKSSIQKTGIAGSTTTTPTLGFGTQLTGSGSNTSISDEQPVNSDGTTGSQVDNLYGTNFRYVRFRYDFAQAGGNDLLQISQIRLKVEVKQKNDQGSGTSLVGTGTYQRVLKTITVTKVGHGLKVGDGVGFDVTSGNASSGDYQVVTVPNANTFTVTDSVGGTAGGNVDFDTRTETVVSGGVSVTTNNRRGTPVFFNKNFVDIEAINASPFVTIENTLVRRFCVVDFLDDPEPTKFHVFLFDENGNQVSGKFSWQCRGR